MKLEHIAIWCRNLEKMKLFYMSVFNATANNKYINPVTGFSSYFLSFPDGGARLELMQMAGIYPNQNPTGSQCLGLGHFSITVGTRDAVTEMTEQLRGMGCAVIRGPRETGDGYFETEALDIEGNRLELMA